MHAETVQLCRMLKGFHRWLLHSQSWHSKLPHFIPAACRCHSRPEKTPGWPRGSGRLCPHGLWACSLCLPELYGNSWRSVAGTDNILNTVTGHVPLCRLGYPGCCVIAGEWQSPGRRIKRSLHVTCLSWAHSWGLTHADWMGGDSVSAATETRNGWSNCGERHQGFSMFF